MKRINVIRGLPIYILLLSCLISGCDIGQRDVLPQDEFLKIYNHPEEALSFYPESVVELPGGGYIFISAVKDDSSDVEYPRTNIVRTNSIGEVLWNQSYDWLAPSSKLIQMGNQVGFVAMDGQLHAYALMVDPESGDITGQHNLEMTMPLAAYTDREDNLLVLGYDFVNRSSWISKYNSGFTLERSVKLSVNSDLEYLIQTHLNRTGQDFPFYIGEFGKELGYGYFINCFYNYTLRSVFLEASSMDVTGDIYSFQIQEAISSLIHKGENMFGLTSYYEGNNYILPEVEINTSASQNIKDFPAEALYELTYKANVVSGSITAAQKDYALFISQTNSNSIVIYQYELASDSLISTVYQSFDERVEVKDFVQTADEGVAILASIFIVGKYRRPALIKLPVGLFIPEEK